VIFASLSRSPQEDLIKSMQAELGRVGCLTGAVQQARRNKFDVKLASLDALDAIKLKPARLCPLVCEHGFKADGDRCSKIVVADARLLNDNNECEKQRAKTPSATRNDQVGPDRAAREQGGSYEGGGGNVQICK